MSEFHRIGRRTFLTDLGRGTLAIAVFTPVLFGCSSDRGVTAAPSSQPVPTTPVDGAVATTAAPATTVGPGTTAAGVTSSAEPATSADDVAGPVTYQRVNLGFVSAYVLVRGSSAAIVDTGVAGSADRIGEVLTATSLGWGDVRHVILTHHHPDHAGSIGDVLTRATNATAYAGAADVASITSPRPLVSVADHDDVFGLQVIGTPGHTPGHISIFDPTGRVLVAGDAINNIDHLTGPDAQFTADMVTAIRSAKLLAALPVDTVYFGHGEPIESGAGAQLVALAASL